METKVKEEWTEYVSLYVTPTIKREIELIKGDKEREEFIVKRFLTNEVEWLEQEIAAIDETVIKYKAKLIGIKDGFGKAQDLYVEQIEELYKKVSDADSKISGILSNSMRDVKNTTESIREVNSLLSGINTYKLEQLMTVVDRFNSMSSDEKNLISKLLGKV